MINCEYITDNKIIKLPQKEVPLLGGFDVAVAGGGPAGFAAAIAASRSGASTVLLEAMPTVLANITSGPLEAIMTFHDAESAVVKGIAQELIDLCVSMGGSSGHVPDTVGYCKTITPFSPEIAKVAAFEMLRNAGITLLLQTPVSDTVIEGKSLRYVIAQSRSSRLAIEAKAFIDCTGDGDLAFAAGCEFEKGDEDGRLQPMTSLVHMGGVDYGKLLDYVVKNKSDFRLYEEQSFDDCVRSAGKGVYKPLHLWGFQDMLERGFREGRLSLRRNEMHLMTGFYGSEAILNFTRCDGDGTNAVERTQAQMSTVKQAYEIYIWLKETIPAFADSYFVSIGTVGIREGRRIKGRYCLTEKDVIEGKLFPDTIAKGAFPIDIHKPGGTSLECIRLNQSYTIPMSSLISSEVDNLLMGGRCICCTHKAQASVRITATSMATGQAAGVIAAMKALSGKPLAELNYGEVRKNLMNQNMILA